MPLLDELLDLLDPSGREWNETFIGLVLLGKIYRKPWFLPSNIGLQCDFHGNLREWREWKCNYLMPMWLNETLFSHGFLPKLLSGNVFFWCQWQFQYSQFAMRIIVCHPSSEIAKENWRERTKNIRRGPSFLGIMSILEWLNVKILQVRDHHSQS